MNHSHQEPQKFQPDQAGIVKLRRHLLSRHLPDWSVPVALFVLCLLSYGLVIPWLGYYWDDWPFVWISQTLGADGVERYFETNRPILGLFFQATRFVGEIPYHWHLFGLFWRWMSALALWGALRLLWPGKPRPADWAAMLFVVYPGFNQQAIANCYGHFFLIFTCYLFSIAAMLAGVRHQGRRWVWFTASGVFTLVHLLSMEYYFLLEFLRPLFLWVALNSGFPGFKAKAWQVFKIWVPYLLLLLGAVIWRVFIFQYQTNNYEMLLLEHLRSDPLGGLTRLGGTILQDAWLTGVIAWVQAFQLPDPTQLGRTTTLAYAALVILTGLLAAAFLLMQKSDRIKSGTEAWVLQSIGLGLAGLFLAGWPFWLTDLPVGLTFPNSRFTLPFMLGAVLLLTGLLGWLPVPVRLRVVLLGVLLGFSVGYQYQVGTSFRRDWNQQKSFFWQLAWRMPALQPGTALVSNDLPSYNSDNSFTAPVNWIFNPQPAGERMPYILYYASIRAESTLSGLQPDQPIEQDYLAAHFSGNTSDLLGIYYQPPGCLRVLDSETDAANPMIPVVMRRVAAMTEVGRIDTEAPEGVYLPPEPIIGTEPSHGWCYYFQKAELARQRADWQEVDRLGQTAFALDDYPNDPVERLPFVEASAHLGDWQNALMLSRQTADISPLTYQPLCALWQRIARNVDLDTTGEQAIATMENELGCAILP